MGDQTISCNEVQISIGRQITLLFFWQRDVVPKVYTQRRGNKIYVLFTFIILWLHLIASMAQTWTSTLT